MRTFISPLVVFSLTVFTPVAVSLRAQSAADTHLDNARAILAAIPAETELVTRDKQANEKATDEVDKLRRQFADLVTGYEAARGANGAELDWKQKFSEVERTLVQIIGGGVALGPTKVGAAVVVQANGTGTASSPAAVVEVPAGGVPSAASNPSTGIPTPPATAATQSAGTVITTVPASGSSTTDTAAAATAVGTSGTSSANQPVGDANLAIAGAKVSTLGIKGLNPSIRRQLETFRTELELLWVSPVAERHNF